MATPILAEDIYRPYAQQQLAGSNTVGFRDGAAEPWIWFRTPMNGAVLSLSGPLPDWEKIT